MQIREWARRAQAGGTLATRQGGSNRWAVVVFAVSGLACVASCTPIATFSTMAASDRYLYMGATFGGTPSSNFLVRFNACDPSARPLPAVVRTPSAAILGIVADDIHVYWATADNKIWALEQ